MSGRTITIQIDADQTERGLATRDLWLGATRIELEVLNEVASATAEARENHIALTVGIVEHQKAIDLLCLADIL